MSLNLVEYTDSENNLYLKGTINATAIYCINFNLQNYHYYKDMAPKNINGQTYRCHDL